jgi:hypothetical protein
MFFVQVSYLAILYAVARRCGLPYVSVIHQVVDDGSHIYGVELQLPQRSRWSTSQTLFFWANPSLHHSTPYEAASLQSLIALQGIYGFVVVDYSIHGLILYRTLAQRLLPIANRGVQLARLVTSTFEREPSDCSALVASAQRLLDELASIPNECSL